jgi:hypothetical protein
VEMAELDLELMVLLVFLAILAFLLAVTNLHLVHMDYFLLVLLDYLLLVFLSIVFII